MFKHLRFHHLAGNFGRLNRVYFQTAKGRANWTRPVRVALVGGYWARV